MNAVDDCGRTAIDHAVKVGQHEDAALYLLETAGAAWETPDGRPSVFFYAAILGLVRFLNAVMKRMRADNTDSALVATYMQTAAVHAIMGGGGGLRVLQTLVENGFDVKRPISLWWTAAGVIKT